MSSCPHCDKPIPPEPKEWLPPWPCSHCGGLYGYGERGPFRVPEGFQPLWPLYSWHEIRRFAGLMPGFWCVYAVCYSNGLPIYVGKGKAHRPLAHVDEAFTENEKAIARHEEKHRVLKSLNEAYGPTAGELYHIFEAFDRESDAYALEASIIKQYGIRACDGMLTNSVIPRQGRYIETPSGLVLDGAINERDKTRFVHHRARGKIPLTGGVKKDWCPVCDGPIYIPEIDFYDKVACPHCACNFNAALIYAKPREFRSNVGNNRSPKIRFNPDG